MNYPVWDLQWAGGGLLIALMAVVHVYVAHFAVGGGLFLVLTERLAHRTGNPAILAYTRRHTRFFMLLTMVFGGLTGVGIWFTISVLNPTATSTLIHTFVFGWATEWVCFLAEIVALFIYYYTFERMRPQDHLRIGWLYFIFAWLSLFLINGIIDFMLTPGGWLASGSFWDGFFNPTMWPALFFRTALALTLAGVFGLLTATFTAEPEAREALIRHGVRWLVLPLVLLVPFAYWYFAVLPAEVQERILRRSPEILPLVRTLLLLAPILAAFGLAMLLRLPAGLDRAMAVALLIAGLMTTGAFEWIREAGRRPFVIYDHTYANAIAKSAREQIGRDGILATARWVAHRRPDGDTVLAAGREIFRLECASCHSVGGPLSDILALTAKYNVFGMDSQLDGLGKINTYMPPFMGTPSERMALARFIVEGLHGRPEVAAAAAPAPQLKVDIPPFDPEKDAYVLLAWNNLGMHCISDSDPWWVLLPPANDLFAQLVRRGEQPEIVTEGVELTYRVQPGFENSAARVRFWEFAASLFGKAPKANTGLSGNGLSGRMKLEGKHKAYVADLIPVVPYPSDGTYNPYPIFTIEAREAESGRLLARTRVVAPTATEMGCRNCHGGKWRVAGLAGFSDETARDVLAVHDKHGHTDLLARAEAGRPQLCQSCHPDPVLGAKGRPGRLNLPAAIHGWHANYLSDRGAEACFQCHPSAPRGPTRCLRGAHARFADCTTCHGTLEDHALSLLKAEQAAGKPGAGRLMKNLRPRTVTTLEEIHPRTPWINEPDCLNCHVDFKRPSRSASAFNRWTTGAAQLYRMRHDETRSLMCEACHSSTHANYPARNNYGADRDNIQPLQYQGNRKTIGFNNCRLCHVVDMEFESHHPDVRRGIDGST